MTAVLSDLPASPVAGASGDVPAAVRAAASVSPYLGLIAEREPDLVARFATDGAIAVFAEQLADMRSAVEQADMTAAMKQMRRAKQRAHLTIAGADLARVWDLDQVVQAMSDLADAAVQTALQIAVRERWRKDMADPVSDVRELAGLFALAMGKMGAGELNYSSDIDLIVLFDLDLTPLDAGRVKESMTRLTRDLVRILDERTVDGYVFRTDLRLRPDPGSTAPAISTQFALGYYESVGQNWERMAHIKARPCAGDLVCGRAYLEELSPYVWRRHLDYWAIADIHSIKRQIHSHHGHAALASAEFDVKLGRGGIREIEFFAQVQQLILGGRFPALRAPRTKDALRAMLEAGVITREVCDDLIRAYDFLRSLEHRIQMIQDEQTHELTNLLAQRDAVRLLAGYQDAQTFEADIARVRRRVHDIYSDLFAAEERLSGSAGNLVFTGVDDDPGTVTTLRELGFSNPSRVIRAFQSWHRGGIPATRSARGRQLLTTLGPRLLEAMGEAGEPDAAFERFQEFFSGLAGGVQAMSLMLAEPSLTRDIINTMAFAPRLASELGRRPALLDSMLERDFSAPVSMDEPGRRMTRLREEVDGARSFEDMLNAARRFHREEAFRIGYQLLRRQISAIDAGVAFADLADACVTVLAEACAKDVESRYGGEVGSWVVCALGKFGGRELSASSDLDLMLIYESQDEGGGALATRFVQRLISALTAPTEEGLLYEVDMQLRPSGRAGPVAVRFSSFSSYYLGEAWTWEHLALTRLRTVCGDEDLARRVHDQVRAVLSVKSADPAVRKDGLDMRRRMAEQRPAASYWDLKLTRGGLVDIEFIAQIEQVLAAGQNPSVVRASTIDALAMLHQSGRLTDAEHASLRDALVFQLSLQQALRIAVGDRFSPEHASKGLLGWLAGQMGLPSFAELERTLVELQSEVVCVFDRRIGLLSDG